MSSRPVIDMGLSRVQYTLCALGNPHQRLPVVIHVAGTNGKGSVCTILASVLQCAGIKVGRFSSPYLLVERDCITVDESIIPEETWLQLQHDILSVPSMMKNDDDDDDDVDVDVDVDVDGCSTLTNFELLTLTALKYFDDVKVDVAVIEVGLGGRFDATNVFDSPAVSIVTSIDFDHQNILGNTLSEIAMQKIGIARPCCPVVIGVINNEDVRKVLFAETKRLGCPVTLAVRPTKLASGFLCTPASKTLETDEGGFSIQTMGSANWLINLRGRMQEDNSATAIAALQIIRDNGFVKFSDEHLKMGTAVAKWRGRLEVINWNSFFPHTVAPVPAPWEDSVLLDGAHNPGGARALSSYISECRHGRGVVWVFAASAGKDVHAILNILFDQDCTQGSKDCFIATGFSSPKGMAWVRSADPETLVHVALRIQPELAVANAIKSSVSDVMAEISRIIEMYYDDTSLPLVVICGSLYLVSDILRYIE